MSKENVVLFSRAVVTKSDLKNRLDGDEDLNKWIGVAEDAGFEFTAEEFCSVVAEIAASNVTFDNAVTKYSTLLQELGPAPLTRKLEGTFIGGAPRACNPWALLTSSTRPTNPNEKQ